jgi:hypothetical protein
MYDAPIPPNPYSWVAPAEQVDQGAGSVARDYAKQQAEAEQRNRAIAAAGRIAVEQTVQRP